LPGLGEIGILQRMFRRRSRVSAAAYAVALSVLALASAAGCDAHSKPTVATEAPQSPYPVVSPSPLSSGSASASPSNGATPPALSTQISGSAALESAYPSAAAAEPLATVIVQQYFDGMNHEISTGDETAVSKTFDPRCTRCISGVVTTKDLLNGGNVLRGGHMHLNKVVDVYPASASTVTVVVESSEDASQQVDGNGKVLRSFSAIPVTKLVFVVHVSELPAIVDLSVLSS
jgi:hypothetical protein